MSRRRHRTRGQALVEFAMVLPMFAMVLFGIIDLGRYVYSQNSLNEAAREAARFGSVRISPPECSGLTRSDCVRTILRNRITGVAVSAADIDVYCQQKVLGAFPDQTAEPPIDNCGGTWESENLLRVRVNVDFTLVTPLIAQFLGTVEMRGEAQVTVNG